MRVCIVKKLSSEILQLLSSCDHLLPIVLACLFVQVPMSASVFTALGRGELRLSVGGQGPSPVVVAIT